jgi:predicted O-methyltransferase YrrM
MAGAAKAEPVMPGTVDEIFAFPFAEGLAIATKKLDQAYTEYTGRVSTPDMAISLEASAFLWVLCEHLQPISILDLGSGFSSFVFRSYAATGPAKVRTIDNDPLWLERTNEFLSAHRLPIEDMAIWNDVAFKSADPFELIFYDLGGMSMRGRELPILLQQVGQKTVLVLDDMHKEGYAETVDHEVRAGGWRYFDALPYTMDQYGRFLGVVLAATHPLLH